MTEKDAGFKNLLELPLDQRVENRINSETSGIAGSIHEAIYEQLLSIQTSSSSTEDSLTKSADTLAWSEQYLKNFRNGHDARILNDYRSAIRYFNQAQKLVIDSKIKKENSRLIPLRDISTSYMKIMCLNAVQPFPKAVMKELHTMSISINEYLLDIIECFPTIKDTEFYRKHIEHNLQNGYIDMSLLSDLINYIHQTVLFEYLTNLRRYTKSNISLDNKINLCILLLREPNTPHEFLKKKLEEIVLLISELKNFSLENSYPFSSIFEIIEKVWTLHFFLTRYGTMHNQFYARCTFNLKIAEKTTPMVMNAAENAQILKILVPKSYIESDPLKIRGYLSDQTSNWLIPQSELHALLENVYETGDSEQRKVLFPESVKKQLEQLVFLYINNEAKGIHEVDFENAIEKLATYHFAIAWSDLSRFTTSYNELETLLSFAPVHNCPKNTTLINVFKSRLALRAAMIKENKLYDDYKSLEKRKPAAKNDMQLPEFEDTVLWNDEPVTPIVLSFNDEASTVPSDDKTNVIYFAEEAPDILSLYNCAIDSYDQLRKTDPSVLHGDGILSNYFDILTARMNLLSYNQDKNKDPEPLNKIISFYQNAIKPNGQIERKNGVYQIQEAEKYCILGIAFIKLAGNFIKSLEDNKKNNNSLAIVFHNIELAETCLCEASGIINQLDYKDEYLLFEIEKAYKELMDVHLQASGVSELKRIEVISRLDMGKILKSFNIQKWGVALRDIVKFSHADAPGQYLYEVAEHLNEVLLMEAPYFNRSVICHRSTANEPVFLSKELPSDIKKIYLKAIEQNNENGNDNSVSELYNYNHPDAGIVYAFRINDFYDLVVDSCYEINETTKEFVQELLKSIDSLFTIHSIRRVHLEGDLQFVFEDTVSLMEHTRVLAHQLNMPHYPTVKHQIEVGKIAESFFDKYWNQYFPNSQIDPHIARLEGELHDLGKSQTNPRLIWEKESTLNRAERLIIEKHPEQGADLCSKLLGGLCAENIAVMFAHHTNYGLGYSYPLNSKGIDGYKIPQLLNKYLNIGKNDNKDWNSDLEEFDFKAYVRSRMLPIFDQGQAISDRDRVYRKPESFENVIGFIKTLAGKDFDPRLVYLFIDAANEGCFDELFLREEFENPAKKYLNDTYCYLTEKEISKIIRYMSEHQVQLRSILKTDKFLFERTGDSDLIPTVWTSDSSSDEELLNSGIQLIKNNFPMPVSYKKFDYPRIFEFDTLLEFLENKFELLNESEKLEIHNKPLVSIIRQMQSAKGKSLFMSAECLHSMFRSEFVQVLKPIFINSIAPVYEHLNNWKEMEIKDPERYKTAIKKYSHLFIPSPKVNLERKQYLENLEQKSPDEFYKMLKQYVENNYYHFIEELFGELRVWLKIRDIHALTKKEILKSPTDKKVTAQ